MDKEDEFDKKLSEVIKSLSTLAEEDGFDDYWFYSQCLQGDYILKSFFEEYYKENEGFSCCVDKASFTVSKIKEMINEKQPISLQETYKQCQENGGDIGEIKDLDKIAYWCPQTIKDSKEAIELFYKNVIKNKTEKLEHKIKVQDEALKELGLILKDIFSDKQKLVNKLEKKLEKVIDERSKLGFKTYMKKEHMVREDCELLGKQKAYKEILLIIKGEKYE